MAIRMASRWQRSVLSIGVAVASVTTGVGFSVTDPGPDEGVAAAESDTGAAIAEVDASILQALATPTATAGDVVLTEVLTTDAVSGETWVEASAELDAHTASIAIEGLVGDPFELEIVAAEPGSAQITTDGALLVETAPDIESMAITRVDASVQVISSIASESASERLDYVINEGEPASISIEESGLVSVTSLQGEVIGFVAPPWAFDANGLAVPTHFEVDGMTLTQVVEHRGGEFTYPVLADPWGGKNLFSHFTYNITTRAHSFRKTEFGASIHYPTNYQIFLNQGWAEFRARTPGQHRITTSVRQQYDCHAAGGYFDWAGPTWDLEVNRPARTNGNWFFGSAFHHCNWTTANGY